MFQKALQMAELTFNISATIARHLPEGEQLSLTLGQIGIYNLYVGCLKMCVTELFDNDMFSDEYEVTPWKMS